MVLESAEWFTEAFEGRTAFSVRVRRKLVDTVSRFQRVEVFETETFGNVLVLDGCFMVTEKDTFVYHEMLVQPAMNLSPTPRKVLVIGGGDGGTVTEIVKHPRVESVILCEIDEMVVQVGREHFPRIAEGLSDPRVRVVHEDGAKFVAELSREFDAVFIDSTDPVGPGKALFETAFYRAIRNSLTETGVAVFQTESPLMMAETFSVAVADLKSVFGSDRAFPYLATIPSYPGALWSFTFCSERRDPLKEAPTAVHDGVKGRLRYYTPEVHRAAFALPVFVRELTEKE